MVLLVDLGLLAFKVRLVLKDFQVQKELLVYLASLVHKEIKEIQGNREFQVLKVMLVKVDHEE